MPNSIAEIIAIDVQGTKQWLVIRGKNPDNPLLLFLHGGPGTPETAFVTHYNKDLENDFVMVFWEQRGAGKSYSSSIPGSTMTMEQFISDAHEVTGYLKKRFSREKVFLVGHSWGTLLGIRTAKRHPEDYYAFVAVAQTSHAAREEALIYDWVYQQAKDDGNEKAIRQLEAIGKPTDRRISLRDLSVKLKWVNHYGGGAFYGRDGFWDLFRVVLKSRVYTLKEKLLYFKGEGFTLKYLYPQISEVNLFKEIDRLSIPTYFLHGRHDYQVPMEAAREYFEFLNAPLKKFVIFENSAHGVLFEEPDTFHRVMLEIIAETVPRPDGTGKP